MPVSYSFRGKVIVIATTGSYSPKELKSCISRALGDSACPPDAVMLLDLRKDLSVMERTREEIRDMSFFIGEIKDSIHSRLCMVTERGLAFGLMNMAKVFDESMGIHTRVFTDYDEAERWVATENTE